MTRNPTTIIARSLSTINRARHSSCSPFKPNFFRYCSCQNHVSNRFLSTSNAARLDQPLKIPFPPDLNKNEGGYTAAETDAYLESRLTLPSLSGDEALSKAREWAREENLPEIAVSPMQGQFLSVLAKSIGASKILEVGTLWGYSTTFLAKVLPSHGQIDTLEIDPTHARIANKTFLECDLYPFPKVHVGPALDLLRDPNGSFVNPPGTDEGLSEVERGYDMVFIDANKDQIDDYFIEAIRLTRQGGIILIDNAVRNGRISREENDRPDIDVAGLRRMYDWVYKDAGKTVIMSGIQTVGAKSWE